MQKSTILMGALLTLACVGCTQAPTEADRKAAETKAAEMRAKDLDGILAFYGSRR